MTRDYPSDDTLVKGLQNPDREIKESAFKGFVERYQKRITQYLSKHTGWPEDLIEDCVQNVFLAVWRGVDRFEGRSEFSTWVLGIARRSMLQELRKKRRPKYADTFADDILNDIVHGIEPFYSHGLGKDFYLVSHFMSVQPGQLDQLVSQEDVAPLRAGIESVLTERQKTVLKLHIEDGLPHKVIGEKLGISENATKKQLSRARKALVASVTAPAPAPQMGVGSS